MKIRHVNILISILIITLISAMSASAEHDASIAMDPKIANCEELGNTFTVSIDNDDFISDADSIFEVRIYSGTFGIDTFNCGVAPVGWTLSDYAGGDPGLSDYGYCEYKTEHDGSSVILVGESLDFTFDAIMFSEACYSEFLISTLDNKRPTGEHEYNTPQVRIDCQEPTFKKVLTGNSGIGQCPPDLQGSGDFCWIRQSPVTGIGFTSTDNVDDSENNCNLGMDRCEWSYTVDGVMHDSGIVDDAEDISFDDIEIDFAFDEDSRHELTITCYDIAGNYFTDVELFRVDDTPPKTLVSYTDPQKNDGTSQWIDGVSTVVIDATDPDPTGESCNIGVKTTYYYNELYVNELVFTTQDVGEPTPVDAPCRDPVNYCNVGFLGSPDVRFDVYDEPLADIEESCHILYYYSVDELGNEEDLQYECYFVDKSAPLLRKDVGTPREDYMLEKVGNGYVDWNTDVSSVGDSSAELSIPKGTSGNDFAGVDSFFDQFISIDSITSLTFETMVTEFEKAWVPIVLFGVDANDNGVFDAKPLEWIDTKNPTYLGGDSILACEHPTGDIANPMTAFETVDVFAEFKCYTVNTAGDNWDWSVYNPLSYFQANSVGQISPSDMVAMIKIHLGGNSNTQDGEIAFVDNVVLNGAVVIDEPTDTFVTSGTDITFTCEDKMPHPSEGEKFCYQVGFDNDVNGGSLVDVTQSKYCSEGTYADGWCCLDVSKTNKFVFNFNDNEDSRHSIEYYCEDAVKKSTDTYKQFYKVDNTEPSITKTMLGADHVGDCPPDALPSNDVCYVKGDGNNGVRIDVVDNGAICAVGRLDCSYEVWWMGEKIESASFSEEGTNVLFDEDSTHTLKVNCVDGLGNTMLEDVEEFKVDITPPTTTKTYDESMSIVKGDYRWITVDTEITMDAVDAKIGVDNIKYRVTNVGDDVCPEACQYSGSGDWTTVSSDTTTFKIADESCHFIEFYAVDKFENTEITNTQCVMVDDSDPEVDSNVGTPLVTKGGNDYITKNTPITLSCWDAEPHPVGDVTLEWRYRTADNCALLTSSAWTGWETTSNEVRVDDIFSFPEDSCHELEYKCADGFSQMSDSVFETYIVDTVAPAITVDVTDPRVDCPEPSDSCHMVDSATEVSITVKDPEPHPVNDVTCDIWYDWNGNDWHAVWNGNDWVDVQGKDDVNLDVPYVFKFPSESEHIVHVECTDGLGNYVDDMTQFFVDKTPPSINIDFGLPYYSNGTSEWINTYTDIIVDVIDVGPHLTGLQETKYRVSKLDTTDACEDVQLCPGATGTGNWDTFPQAAGGVTFAGEQSCHLIEVEAIDNVDKSFIEKRCVFVDTTPPTPSKTVGVPNTKINGPGNPDYSFIYYPEVNDKCNELDGIDCWKVTKLTAIDLACVDQEPHPVGKSNVCFKVGWDAEDKTADYCAAYQGNPDQYGDGFCCLSNEVNQFYFTETTEHNLQYYCVDELKNIGPIDSEMFKVEETAFTIELNKKWNLISVPVKLLDNSMDAVFADIATEVISVWQYDGVDWHVYTPDGINNDDITTMEPGWGYWVLTNAEAELTIGGSLISPAMVPPSIPVYHNGWNLIGYYGADGRDYYEGPSPYSPVGDTAPADCKLGTLRNSVWDTNTPSLFTWWEPFNTDHNSDTTPLVGLNSWMDLMDPGAGYWLFYTGEEDGVYSVTSGCDDYYYGPGPIYT